MIDKKIALLAVGTVVIVVIGIAAASLNAPKPPQKDGKTAVEILVIPKDSTITIDDQKAAAGTVYLEPGEHTFKANKEGWQEDTATLKVGEAPVKVRLLPIPTSSVARAWINQHPDEEREGELLGGEKANEAGNLLYQKNPIVDQLPFKGPDFEITYSESDQSPTGVEVLIISTTPAGRSAALQQIRSWTYDPSNMYIIFVGYANPLQKSGVQ